jgi:hypothetical protein
LTLEPVPYQFAFNSDYSLIKSQKSQFIEALATRLSELLGLPLALVRITSVYDGSIVIIVTVPSFSVPPLQAAVSNGFSLVFNSQTFSAIPYTLATVSTTTSTHVITATVGSSVGSKGSSGSSAAGPNIGGIVGGVAVLVLIIVVLIVIRKRRSKAMKREHSTTRFKLNSSEGGASSGNRTIENHRAAIVPTLVLDDNTERSCTQLVHLSRNTLYSGEAESSVDEVPLSQNPLYGESTCSVLPPRLVLIISIIIVLDH